MADTYRVDLDSSAGYDPGQVVVTVSRLSGYDCDELYAEYVNATWWQPRGQNKMVLRWTANEYGPAEGLLPCELCVGPEVVSVDVTCLAEAHETAYGFCSDDPICEGVPVYQPPSAPQAFKLSGLQFDTSRIASQPSECEDDRCQQLYDWANDILSRGVVLVYDANEEWEYLHAEEFSVCSPLSDDTITVTYFVTAQFRPCASATGGGCADEIPHMGILVVYVGQSFNPNFPSSHGWLYHLVGHGDSPVSLFESRELTRLPCYPFSYGSPCLWSDERYEAVPETVYLEPAG